MPYYKFNEDDIFHNRIKAHPSCHFITWKGCTYYNNKYVLSGAFNSVVGHVSGTHTSSGPSGYINLYEMNVDRPENLHNYNTGRIKDGNWTFGSGYSVAGTATMIYPWTTKDGSRNTLKSVSYSSYVDDYSKGDVISGSYPLTASVTRIFYAEGSAQNGQDIDPNPKDPNKPHYYQNKEQTTVAVKDPANPEKEKTITDAPKLKKSYIQALENAIDFYRMQSPHFTYSSSFHPVDSQKELGWHAWDKSYQAVSIIDIPSIFFGESIKKGTVDLKYYITGTLIGELKDEKENGELIQIGPSGSFNSGSVAGIVLYNEGALVLTGSWDLTSNLSFTGPATGLESTGTFGPAITQDYEAYGSANSPSWVYFGTGMNDGYPNNWDAYTGLYNNNGTPYSLTANSFHSSSFELAFSGTNYIPTITMMAHAKKGYLNWSNNPTYIEYGQQTGSSEGSTFYKESDSISIKNTISSSFVGGHTASFKKQTFIDKIGIYDKDKNLIAIAKVATPVRKLETDEYTFKLKLDI